MFGTVAQNLIDPAILFFIVGAIIGLLRSNFEVPQAIAKFLTLYLLMALGLKGGAELAKGGLPAEGAFALIAALIMATLIPAFTFLLLQRRINPFDAAAVAGTYGSVSAVTFIATQQFLAANGMEFGGYMTVAMVLMETPAIVMAVLLASYARAQASVAARDGDPGSSTIPALSLRKVLQEALTDGSQLLLIGSLIVGYVSGEQGKAMMSPFSVDIFKGLLAFFLLEMGLLVGKHLRDSQVGLGRLLLAFAILAPPFNAMVGLLLGWTLGLQHGDAMLLAVLSASASYIVVPAIARYAIPEARPGVYFTMALGLTFPFNILVGIPLYFAISNLIWT